MKNGLALLVRGLGFTLGGLAATVGSLCFLAWVSFDGTHVADTLAKQAQSQYQRTLSFTDTPRLRLWPRPALLLRGVTLSEAKRSDAALQIGELRLELGLLPLLTRRIEIRGVQAEDLQTRVQRGKLGDWNFADLLATPPNADALSWRFAPERVRIENLALKLEDLRNEHRISVEQAQATFTGLRDGAVGDFTLEGQWQNADTHSNLHFTARGHQQFSQGLQAGAATLIEASLKGQLQELKNTSAHLKLNRLIWSEDGEHGRVDGVSFVLQTAPGARAVAAEAALPVLTWRGRSLQGERARAQLTLRTVHEQNTVELNLPRLERAEQGFRSAQARLDWRFQDEHGARVQSQLQGQLDARLEPYALQLTELRGQLELTHPRLKAEKLGFELGGSITTGADGSRLQLQAGTADKRLALHLDGQLQQLWPMRGQLDLDAPHLDLRNLLRAPAREPLWVLPEGTALAGRLNVKSLLPGEHHLEALQARYSLSPEALRLQALGVGLYGGRFKGELSLEKARRLSLQGEFTPLALDTLADAAGWKLPLTGKLSGSCRLSADLAAAEPLATLNGALRWRLSNARLAGTQLAQSLRELRPAIAAGKPASHRAAANEHTALTDASSRFVFTNGELEAESIQARTTWLTLKGSGKASLPAGTLDFPLTASLAAANAPEARELASLRGKPFALRLQGPLLNPSLNFEPGTAPAARK